jgi:transaldolase / glucose-6-phosphate isomerase
VNSRILSGIKAVVWAPSRARGDLQVLVERGRRALRVHLGPDVKGGLATLRSALTQAMR